mgnify:CR=1 FL=1
MIPRRVHRVTSKKTSVSDSFNIQRYVIKFSLPVSQFHRLLLGSSKLRLEFWKYLSLGGRNRLIGGIYLIIADHTAVQPGQFKSGNSLAGGYVMGMSSAGVLDSRCHQVVLSLYFYQSKRQCVDSDVSDLSIGGWHEKGNYGMKKRNLVKQD